MSDTPSLPAGGTSPGHVEQLLATLGGRPVLLPIPAGTKGPRYAGWQKLTWENTQDPEYRLRVPESPLPGERFAGEGLEVWRERRYADLLPAGNIGVLQGAPSILEEDGKRWQLCSIDVDDTPAVDGFVALNPLLKDTLRTVGARGCNFWVWVEGECPPLHKDLCWIATTEHDCVRSPGKLIKVGDKDVDQPWGEWRATGGQTVIYGQHPSGSRYTRTGERPVRIKFADITWPEGLHLPWVKKVEAPAVPPPPAPADADEDKLDTLIKTYGEPWVVGKKGNLTVNQVFFAGFFATKHRVIFSAEEQRFFRYQGEKSGLWSEQTADAIRWEFAADIKLIGEQNAAARPEDIGLISKLIMACTTPMLGALVGMLRGGVEKWRAFERTVSPKTNRPRALVHLKNTMLDLDEFPPVPLPFAPEYMSRNQLNVALDEKAECPKFIAYLKAAVTAEDVTLMQKFAGQMLLGVNLTQKLLILEGTAGGGKSTFVNIIAELIGRVNVAQLRTRHLGERFEIFGFLDKTLLIGVDVPGNFMMVDGAEVIKALCGGDLLDAEAKTGNRRFQVKGEFNILITCNTRMKVKLDGDGDAWRRRMGIVTFNAPKPEKPDPNFVQKLLAEEASGMLNWAIEGALMLLKDIEDFGGLQLGARHKDRVESLLAESDSVKDFVRRGCVKAPRDAKVTTEQLQQAYVDYCEERGWAAVGGKALSYQLPDALLEIHGATAANDIKLHADDKAKRGYRGVAVKAAVAAEELPPVAEEGEEPAEGHE
jgi:putative DNA primase/helicase